MQAQPEIRVFTVPQDLANDTIRLRQTFGWSFVSSSARSFATHADTAFAGASGAHVFGGGGRMAVHNAHFVDLTLQRFPTPRNLQLAQLELQYELAEIKDLPRLGWNLAGWLVMGWIATVLVAVVALEKAPTSIAWGIGVPVGIGVTGLLIVAWIRRRRQIVASNAKALAVRKSILHRVGAAT